MRARSQAGSKWLHGSMLSRFTKIWPDLADFTRFDARANETMLLFDLG
jgi:hypothetical protein